MALAFFFIRFVRYSMETVGAMLCLSGHLERRPHFFRRLMIAIAAALAVSAALAFAADRLGMGFNDPLSRIMYAVLSLMSFLSLFFLHRGSLPQQFFFGMNGVMLRMLARKTYEVFRILARLRGMELPLFQSDTLPHYVAYYAVMACLYLAASRTIGAAFRRGKDMNLPGRLVGVYGVMLAINLILSSIEPVLETASLRALIMLMICEIAYYGLLLVLQWFFFQMAQTEVEAAITQELWRQDRRQFELMKETIELINIKCHDLRHHIREIQEGSPDHADYLSEVAHSINIYDSVIQTGSKTLDVILTDKRLRCDSMRIQLTTMADGAALAPMAETDIYALFGNLLDNAIEYEAGLREEEKRFISLSVRHERGLVSIRVENSYEGPALQENQLPATTKPDAENHGYGLKSVRRIVEKYGGAMNLVIQDGMFQVLILLPL